MSGAVVMVYVMPMLLGQTYDVGKSVPGIQIFNASTTENAEVVENYFTDSQYRMVEDSSDIKNFLDVSGRLSLKVKSGMVDASGEGSYLKERASRSNAIEILVKVSFQTITRTIRSYWLPNIDWSLEDKKFLGTHYCRSITYGGELIASLRFLATNQFDKERIKGAIQAEVNAKSLEAGLKGKLEMLKEQLHDSSSMEIRYYATVPIPGVPHDIKSLMKLVDDFPSHVKKVNGGLGNPLRMELYPLHALKTAFTAYTENGALSDQLEDLEDQFDDLLTTRREISLWLSDLPPLLPPEVDEKITKFTKKIETAIAAYTKAIGDMDFAEGGLLKSFEDLFKIYQDGERMLPHKYSKKFRKLQKEIFKEVPELEPLNGGATYPRWGKSECGKNEETVARGIVVTSDSAASSGFQCSPIKPNAIDPESKSGSLKRKARGPPKMMVKPIRYNGYLPRFREMRSRSVPCAICRALKETSVFTFHGLGTCPKGWTLAYGGFTMAPGIRDRKGKYICIDKTMTQPAAGSTFKNLADVLEVGVQCGILPCDEYKGKNPLSCAVCKR